MDIPKIEQPLQVLSANMYPNPSTDIVTIEYTLPFNAGNCKLMFGLYDNYGNLIKEFQINSKPVSINSFNLDVSDLVDGIYMYRLQFGNSQITKKLIVQK